MDAGGPPAGSQGDVFGLATAFITQGVPAYIAPLWPVDDRGAAQLAVDFYRALLLDRASLGESLRRARADLPAGAAPGWAGFTLYGDPTPRLLESLWTPRTEAGAARPRPAD